MNLAEYQMFTRTTAIYPKQNSIEYCSLGLASEAGEVCGKVKKWVRDGTPLNELKAELGDVLWYVVRLADECGWNAQEIMTENRKKLEDRKARNVLKGSGDTR